MSDVMSRAKAALEQSWGSGYARALHQGDLARLVPELVAEIERLRNVLIDGAVADYQKSRSQDEDCGCDCEVCFGGALHEPCRYDCRGRGVVGGSQ